MATKNGLIDLGNSIGAVKDYSLFSEDSKAPCNFASDALKGNIQLTPVSKLFFSKFNIEVLQKGIRYTVLNKTCGKYNIGNQSSTELMVIMRSIYLQESMNSILDIVKQVKELNARVIMYSAPRIIEEVRMHNAYIERISQMPIPLTHGVSTSLAGTKTLEMPKF